MSMNTTDSAMEQFQKIIGTHMNGLPGNQLSWLKGRRSQAAERFKSEGFPTRKQEAWRYSNVDSLLKELTAKTFVYPDADLDSFIQRDLLEVASEFHSYRVVFLNGRYCAQLSLLKDLPQGVYIANLRQTVEQRPELLKTIIGSTESKSAHAFNALNTALFNEGMVLHIESGQQIDKPIEVVYLTTGGNNSYVFSPRNTILLDNDAKATVVERYVGSGNVSYFNNGLSEIVLRENAELTHYRMQEENLAAYHLSTISISHAERSRYVGNNIILGGAWSRTEYNVDFKGEHAESELDGVYLVRDKQLADVHLHIKHAVPNCSSRQDYRGILSGKGRGVFDGLIEVEKHAQKTQAHLANANLMLSRSAEVDTKPQLLIYADDVKCSHGTTVGQIEPEQLFYLRSRGISEPEAQKMLCLGFAGEVLERCELPELRERAELALRDAIESAPVVS